MTKGEWKREDLESSRHSCYQCVPSSYQMCYAHHKQENSDCNSELISRDMRDNENVLVLNYCKEYMQCTGNEQGHDRGTER